MVFLVISMALTNIIKGSGAWVALLCAHSAFRIAAERGGWYMFLYVAALYLVGLSGICLYESACDFFSAISSLFDDEDEDIDM